MIGLDESSPWITVVRLTPSDTILRYVHAQWARFSQRCAEAAIDLQTMNEPTLTQRLGAVLTTAKKEGAQPFQGDFYAELRHQTFRWDTMTVEPASRTDIAFAVTGQPLLIIEFKLLNGSADLRRRYVKDGLNRFVSGFYASDNVVAAMWAFLRTGGEADPGAVRTDLDGRGAELRSPDPSAAPSTICGLATFDTSHRRDEPRVPITVAHFFVALP